ncbi:MAG: Fe-S cluster assembly ATPase SufC [Oscillospiraceae bacterium]|jgi:Fe-S cluster assembly ATP-binding protein
MADELLRIKDLHAGVEDKEILKGLSLTVGRGETHVIMGPNGAGKSTLGNVIMGNPVYKVLSGTAEFDGKDLFSMPVNERAKAGIFMSFQNPIEVPGITLEEFMRTAIEERTGEKIRIWSFHKKVQAALETLMMDPEYAERDLNVGFSGGEKKKAEILQLMLLEPKLAILDETDSGLDVDAVRTVSKGIEEYQKNQDSALIIITHSTGILSSLHVDRTHVVVDGRIVADSDASLVDEINKNGFSAFEEKAAEN